ncbi:MAG: hypothetical protein QF886_07960, partial [Planctomycetota bacterium]|nr:hypothetical protein [Planctomycetota bacterium]
GLKIRVPAVRFRPCPFIEQPLKMLYAALSTAVLAYEGCEFQAAVAGVGVTTAAGPGLAIRSEIPALGAES